jgi:cytochrome c biogenesis protein CcmG/thiol:disulfide interchange protein DsbE
MNRRYLVPLALFGVTVVLLGAGLTLDPREVPSPPAGRPAPAFELPTLAAPDKRVTGGDFAGQVWILNVWASWCVSCREEHSALTALARSGAAPVIGLNFKDEREHGLAWLGRYGDPYALSLQDRDGRLGTDYGIHGVPETFVIDKKGVIRYQRIGLLTPEVVEGKILPLVKALQAGDR